MATAIGKALDLIEDRKKLYRENGHSYYRPWIFMITGGGPAELDDVVKRVVHRIRDGEKQERFAFFAVGVEGANMASLNAIATRKPLMLCGLDFVGLFEWLSRSAQAVSHSDPGDQVVLLPPISWDVLQP